MQDSGPRFHFAWKLFLPNNPALSAVVHDAGEVALAVAPVASGGGGDGGSEDNGSRRGAQLPEAQFEP